MYNVMLIEAVNTAVLSNDDANLFPCSMCMIMIVDKNITGNAANVPPHNGSTYFPNITPIEMTVPHNNALEINFSELYLICLIL